MSSSEKNELRSRMKQLIASLSNEEKNKASLGLHKNIVSGFDWNTFSCRALFASDETEISTYELAQVWKESLIVFPKIENERMNFFPSQWNDLKPGVWGILEPTSGEKSWNEQIEVMCVPGRAFDTLGNRLGRGKGYYDRYLAEYGQGILKIGVCYEFQVVDRVPTESTDQKVDWVITEKGIYECN